MDREPAAPQHVGICPSPALALTMGKRRPNWRLIKVHRNYTVEEAAGALHKHKNTVRTWLKAGLPTIDGRRPSLILGQALAAFLRARCFRRGQHRQPNQFYCVRCRAPKVPAGDMVEYMPMNASSGNLRGICPDYGHLIHRRIALTKLPEMRRLLDISEADAEPRLRERADACGNCDSRL